MPTVRALPLAIIASLMTWLCAADAGAQSAPDLKAVGLDGLPERVEMMTSIHTTDLLIVPPPRLQRSGEPMMRVLVQGDMYQKDPVIFGNPNWSNIRVDSAFVDEDHGTMWAVGGDAALYRPVGGVWQMIEMSVLNRSLCQQWEQFGAPCQSIVPVGEDRAIVMRPTRENGRVGSQVVALVQGKTRPLATVTLPGIALGPAVTDGEGGFWVMLRRTERTSNYKPMRGYLHYTKQGNWLMWSDSGESVEGTQFKGEAAFLIDSDVRKMASDGRGGFVSIGRDRLLWRVGADGTATRFSEQQPRCQYCQPMAIDYDAEADRIHLLLGEWREGGAGQVEEMGPTRWLSFGAEDGVIIEDQPIPWPEGVTAARREVYEEIQIAARGGSAWIAGPDLLLHHDRQGWFWLTEVADVHEQDIAQIKKEQQEQADPARYITGVAGDVTLGIGGAIAGTVIASSRSEAPDQALGAIGTGFALSTLGGYYPGRLLYPATSSRYPKGGLRGFSLIGGAAAMIAVTGGVTWLWSDYVEVNDQAAPAALSGRWRGAAGAFGGAAIGTLGSMYFTSLIVDFGGAEAADSPWTHFLGSMAASGLAAVGYSLLSPRWGRNLSGME